MAIAIFLFVCAPLLCAGEPALPIEVVDIAGAKHSLPSKDKKATVVIFITNDCPMANGYAPEIKRIGE